MFNLLSFTLHQIYVDFSTNETTKAPQGPSETISTHLGVTFQFLLGRKPRFQAML